MKQYPFFSRTTGLVLLLITLTGLTGCTKTDSVSLKVGATVGPHAQVVEAVAREAEKQGLAVEVIEFSDYITPNAALAEGSIDINSYQHQPFLDNYNRNNGTDLVPIGKSILMRMGIYSNRYKSLGAVDVSHRQP